MHIFESLIWNFHVQKRYGKRELIDCDNLGSLKIIFTLLIKILVVFVIVNRVQFGKSSFEKLFSKF